MSRPLLALFVCLALPATSAAHISLVSPTPRLNSSASQKRRPCGGLPRGLPQYFAPGQDVVMQWNETVPHPGWYRVVFSLDGTTGFADPTNWLDNDIPDKSGRESYEWTVTLPAVECDQCVLQLVQVMTDPSKAPDPTSPTGYPEYYACVDLVLSNDPPPDGGCCGVDAGPTDSGGASDGGTTSDAGSTQDGGGPGSDGGPGSTEGGCISGVGGGFVLPLCLLLVYSLLAPRRR